MRGRIRTHPLLIALLFVTLPAAASGAEPPVTVTIYNDNLGMIREVRALQLVRGTQEYRITDVAAEIDPGSVRLRSLTTPESFRLQEQRFEFDLTGTDRLLERWLGQPIVVTIEEGGTYRGKLLSAPGGDAILELEDKSIQVIKAQAVTTLQFPGLPEGLTTKPTLVWLLESTKSGKHEAEITYLTRGLSWQAEYTASLHEGGDRLELSGWASIENSSGLTFKDAAVQLVAGDVHRVAPQPYLAKAEMRREVVMMAEAPPSEGFEEQPLFEYHLYTLERPATLTDREAVQLTLFPRATVKAAREFTYDGSREKDKVRINVVLTDTKENGLGMPLPAGRIRVYKAAGGGPEIFAGEDRIGHVAEGEEVRVYLGNAFDIVGERTVTETRQISKRSRQETVEISLRNRKDEPATVTVIEHFRGDWKFIGTTPKIRKKEAHEVEFEVAVPKKSEQAFTYQVLYTW
jgi:hypothetical protein